MDVPGSATATADTAVKKGRTKKASLMSFMVNGRHGIRFGSTLFLDIELVFGLDRDSQNQSSGDDSNLIFIFNCSENGAHARGAAATTRHLPEPRIQLLLSCPSVASWNVTLLLPLPKLRKSLDWL